MQIGELMDSYFRYNQTMLAEYLRQDEVDAYITAFGRVASRRFSLTRLTFKDPAGGHTAAEGHLSGETRASSVVSTSRKP